MWVNRKVWSDKQAQGWADESSDGLERAVVGKREHGRERANKKENK